MKIRTRVFLIIALSTIVASLILYASSSTILTQNYRKIEDDLMARDLTSIKAALDRELDTMGRTALDWSIWDDTYNFALDGNQSYLDSNFQESTFENIDINMFAMFDPQNQPFFVRCLNLENREYFSLPDADLKTIAKSGSMGFLNSETSYEGIVDTSEGPMLIAAGPILDTNGERPSLGTLVLGRFLDSTVISGLENITGRKITISGYDRKVSPLSASRPLFIRPEDSESLAGSILIFDIENRPYLTANILNPREVYRQGMAAIAWIHAGIAIIATLIILITMLALEYSVIRRLKHISDFALNIARKADFRSRIRLSGKDEITLVGKQMNAMMDKLSETNNTLEELYHKEKKQRQELEAEAKARGMFIDILAHELRTPLTPVLSSTGILRDLLDNDKDAIKKKLINNIHTSADTLARRLEELLDVARYSRGVFKLNLQPYNLNSFIEDVITRFSPMLDARKQVLVRDIQVDLPEAEIDASRLEQVLMNLVSNASKFSSEKGEIVFSVHVDRDMLSIFVKDEGIGITSEEQSKLFEPYHRVEQDRQKFPGLGLGLAVCKQIVEAHGGRIWVKSLRGEGSTFFFEIPLKVSVVNINA